MAHQTNHKSVPQFIGDILLVVVGVYLALWMESKVQEWENSAKQKEYIKRLVNDLEYDIKQMERLVLQLEKKSAAIERAIGKIQSGELDSRTDHGAKLTVDLGSTINSYFFFEPQNFTYLSMRESGDFKLLTDDRLKSNLVRHYSNYNIISTFQKNYMQGLDDEFIPMWVRNVDMLNQKLLNKDLSSQVLFKNMAAFAFNEATNRKRLLETVLEQTKQLKQELSK